MCLQSNLEVNTPHSLYSNTFPTNMQNLYFFPFKSLIPFLSFNRCWRGPDFRISCWFFKASSIMTWRCRVFFKVVQSFIHFIHLLIFLCKFLTNLRHNMHIYIKLVQYINNYFSWMIHI